MALVQAVAGEEQMLLGSKITLNTRLVTINIRCERWHIVEIHKVPLSGCDCVDDRSVKEAIFPQTRCLARAVV